jgi:hypothetical protein
MYTCIQVRICLAGQKRIGPWDEAPMSSVTCRQVCGHSALLDEPLPRAMLAHHPAKPRNVCNDLQETYAGAFQSPADLNSFRRLNARHCPSWASNGPSAGVAAASDATRITGNPRMYTPLASTERKAAMDVMTQTINTVACQVHAGLFVFSGMMLE